MVVKRIDMNEGDVMENEIVVNGEKYIKVVPPVSGRRVVLVVDRGWIFAGDLTEENGRIFLDRAVWVFRWESVGFAAVVADPVASKADLRRMSTRVDVPVDAEVFRLPVCDTWGL
jgi:hypothetical protein